MKKLFILIAAWFKAKFKKREAWKEKSEFVADGPKEYNAQPTRYKRLSKYSGRRRYTPAPRVNPWTY